MPRVIKCKNKIQKVKVKLKSFTAETLSDALIDMCQNGKENYSKEMKVYMSMNDEGTEIGNITEWSFYVDFGEKYMIYVQHSSKNIIR